MSDLDVYGQGGSHSDFALNITLPITSIGNPLPGQYDYATITQLHANNEITGRITGTTDGMKDGSQVIYNSYAGVDIVAQVVLPREKPVTLGELQTISYSIHRENNPVRVLGRVSPIGFVKGSRTIAGSMVFTVFNNYAFYRLKQFQEAIDRRLYPLADMLPPLDIVLTFANESGVFSKMKIYGATLVDEGGTMSIDDLIVENTFSYMARGIQPMTGFGLPELA